MKNLFKLSLLMSLTTLVLTANAHAEDAAADDTLVNTAITLYSSSNHTVVVLRQAPRKIEFFTCGFFKGSAHNPAEIRSYFEKKNDNSSYRANCQPLENLNSKTYKVTKSSIAGREGVSKYIYTQSGSVEDFVEVWSEVAAWSIDVENDLGVSPWKNVELVGTRIVHDRDKNAEVSSFRDSYKFIGAALTQYPVMKK